ncbi:uncharacterized protein LOC130724929 [Lotus japonicus]|uniref:uncharacterized protein LOC130724929 n=1 Tax=Lotus japonicus TaxID=34305 RepID=UPI002585EF96|nr:uncharacterized protein LOC130724929 [Lotus japonicus]
MLGVAVLWWMWRWRNHRVFGDNHWTLNQVLRNILRDVTVWKKVLLQLPSQQPAAVASSIPGNAADAYRLTTDGSWDPLRNRMGCAVVLWNGNGDWVSAISMCAGPGCAFLAEVAALEMGLQHAMDLDIHNLECYSDCFQLVSLLLTDSDTSTFWARDSIDRIRSMLGRFHSIHILHAQREKNNTADGLAREARKIGSPTQIWGRPPSFVYDCLYLDAVS